MINVGIVGGTGYAGAELLRLLATHQNVRVGAITSRQAAGQRVTEMFPHLRGYYDGHVFAEPTADNLSQCEVVFFATPHATAMHLAPQLRAAGQRVIDLSADFRLKDPDVWAQWYGQPHACPELLQEAVYGLPEINREKLVGAGLVACPGCYPTAVILGLLPLLDAGVVEPKTIIADAKTGASGAGRALKQPFLFGEMSGSFKAYGVAGHRHWPEIEQVLNSATRQTVGVTFVPHLVPMIRGIHATLYARLQTDDVALQTMFEQYFDGEPFVDVMPAGSTPETRSVRGNNNCRLAVYRPAGGDTVVVLSVIDNLVKGASGQGVQCFNIMHGFAEDAGLRTPALIP